MASGNLRTWSLLVLMPGDGDTRAVSQLVFRCSGPGRATIPPPLGGKNQRRLKGTVGRTREEAPGSFRKNQ